MTRPTFNPPSLQLLFNNLFSKKIKEIETNLPTFNPFSDINDMSYPAIEAYISTRNHRLRDLTINVSLSFYLCQ